MLKKSSNGQKGFTISASQQSFKPAAKQHGFTIIEVLIVLAIAGLILLIVFLAVPALQRNSRNTQRKNDISSVLSGVSEYVNNNSGALPANIGASTASPTTTIVLRSGATGSGTEVKLGYYDPTTVTRVQAGTAVVTNNTTAENMVLVTRAKCSGSDATGVGAPSRGYVALYSVESGSTATKVCQEG